MEILVHFDMWNENRKILSSIFHFTSLRHTPLYENSQKWGKIQKLQLSEHFSRKQNGHELVIEIQRGKVSNPINMATVEV